MASLKVKLVRSMSGHTAHHRETLVGMGLTKMNRERLLPDNAATRGMIAKVGYLLEWSESTEEFKPFGKRASQKQA